MHSQHSRVKLARVVVNRILAEALEDRVLLSTSPSITTISPSNGATNVPLNVNIQAQLNLPNGGLNPTTVNTSTFYLYQTKYPNNNAKFVSSSVKTTGGGDALLLSPLANLLPNTSYTLVATAGIQDVNGDAFTPFTESFTTSNTVPPVSQSYAFSQTALPSTSGYAITDVQMGPDGNLWASTEVGQILRFPVNTDGTLGTPQVITSLQTANVSSSNPSGDRLISGFAFDPSFIANPSAPMIWVSNTYYALTPTPPFAPDFSGALTVMSGTNLQTVTNVVVGLPRSVSDHINDQPVFQPGTDNLFFCQAGENAYGAPDSTWGYRAETLLSAAILELNTASPVLNINTPSQPPLNVVTPDARINATANSVGTLVGGTYDPYAANAPLTIYATGIRNAFDLMFDEEGQLWAPANGSSSGGNAPAGPGNSPPALSNIQQVEEDTMFKVVKGAYYGHPDPVRGQYVLDQGNPATGAIPGLAFSAYPAGTNPDPAYQLPNYVFGLHASPDGIIEYEGSAFGGALNGKFLVAEYSAPDDVVVLSRDSSDNIIGGLDSTATGPTPDRSVTGFTGLNSPVSLVENQASGYIYVSQLGADNLILLKPASVSQKLVASTTVVPFNTIASGNTGAGPSRTETVTITNDGADPLNFSSISVVNNPADPAAASNFTIVNSGSLPTSLNTLGASMTIQIQYSATAVGLQSALLQIKSNDPTNPTLNIDLHGIGTAGQFGSLEPSLVQVLRAYNIPTIVGAGPNDININTVNYPYPPATPDASSQEVPLQILEAAGPGNVTITPLASFSASASPVSTIGFYTPDDAASATALFSIAKADAQTISPTAVGSTTFNPGGGTFGLYAYFPGITTPGGVADYHYSQDDLNSSLDPVAPHKIRFFPYKTANGTVVPNSYIFAIEDYNGSTYNSFVNFVGIISNVTGVPAVPTNLTANLTNAGIVLNWTPSPTATSYNVESEAPGATSFTVIATGLTSPTYTDTTAGGGTGTYAYAVQAQNPAGTSAFSAAVQGTEAQGAPATPSNLQVTSTTVGGVTLTWNAAAGATSYSVLREDSLSPSFTTIATGLTSTTFIDTSVLPDQTYQYEIVSANGLGNSGASRATTAVVPPASATTSVVIGKTANKSVQFTTDAGTTVTIKFNGLGTATVNFSATTVSQTADKTGVIVSGTDLVVSSIVATGTATNSVLTITTKGGSGTVTVGEISADGSINAINAKTTALVAGLDIPGAANRIQLGSVTSATITVGGNLGTLAVPLVSSGTLTVGGAIRNINSIAWDSAEPITASSIGSINIAGNAHLNVIAGAVHAIKVKGTLNDSTIALSGSGITALAMLNAGAITSTNIDTSGSIGSITAGALDNSQIFAGNGTTPATFPPVSGSFAVAALIGRVNLKKTAGTISMTNSNIAAFRINSLSLGIVQFSNNGTAFGAESTYIGALHGVDDSTSQSFAFTRLVSNSTVTADFTAKGIAQQDFTIQIV